LDHNPLLTASVICKVLDLPYKKHADYVHHIKTQWKKVRFGRGLNCPKFHNWQGSVYLPVDVSREAALSCGWKQTRARNRALLWKDRRLGRLEWFETGRVNIRLRKPADDGRLAQLLANAFFKTDLIHRVEVLEATRKAVRMQGAHAVYETGERLPYRLVSDFRDYNGVVVRMGDASHPAALEIEFHRPKWNEETEETLRTSQETMRAFIDVFREPSRPGRLRPASDVSVV
jgi:hypothetical protein